MTKPESRLPIRGYPCRRKVFRAWILLSTMCFMTIVSSLVRVRDVAAFSKFQLPPASAVIRSQGRFAISLSSAHSQTIEDTVSQEEAEFYVHGISPESRPLFESAAFYARYILNQLAENRRKNLLKRKGRRRFMSRLFKEPKSSTESADDIEMSVLDRLRQLNEQRKNIVKLAGYTRPIVIPSFTFLLLGAFMSSLAPKYYSQCIAYVSANEASRSKMLAALTGLAMTAGLEALFTGFRGSLFWIAGSRANYNVRVKLHRSLLLQEAAFFDSNEVGDLLSRLNNDVNKIGNVVSIHVNVVLRQLAMSIFGSFHLVRISPRLSLWSFAGIGLVAWVSAVYGEFNRNLAEKVQDMIGDGSAVAETSFSMSETIRAFNGVKDESSKYRESQFAALELEETQAWGYGTHKFVSDVLQAVLQITLLFSCWAIARSGGLSTEDLTSFVFYTNFVLESSNEVGDQWAKIQGSVGASSSVFDLIRRLPKVRDPVQTQRTEAVTPNPSISPIISLKNVTVTYDALGVPALNQVDLDIYPSDRVAIVGRSGSGKSTLLRALMRFYDPSCGTCELKGQSLTNLTREEIASMVSVVQQEPQLFPLTLLENVLYGVEKDAVDSSTGEVCYSKEYREAARKSLLMAGLPIGANNDLNLDLESRVGEGGRALSGGQRQRVAIARALVRNPEVLLLDEPTAALDSGSEKKVVAALKSAMEHARSMVMVTHRLGVIRPLEINRVLVMEKGRIVEQGRVDDLMRDPNGLFAKLAREQGIMAEDIEVHEQTRDHLSCQNNSALAHHGK